MTTRLPRFVVAGLLGLTMLLSACSVTAMPAQPEVLSPAAVAEATTTLSRLPVKGKAPKTGYERSKFGPAWKDVDRNGCDTRNDILKRDMIQVKFSDKKQCAISSGLLDDPYTGKMIDWTKGSNLVDIEHLVALGQAWVSGAQQLTAEQRTELANDPINLIAADAGQNRAKGDREASAWLPPNKAYRCTYVASQIDVKAKYVLSVTAPEKAAMLDVLEGCVGPDVVVAEPKVVEEIPAPEVEPAFETQEPELSAAHPGSFCAQNGAKGMSKAGKMYVCKVSESDVRLRWRA